MGQEEKEGKTGDGGRVKAVYKYKLCQGKLGMCRSARMGGMVSTKLIFL